MFVDVDAT
jgi:succinyl-CoA synthetase beta subunit